MLKIKIPLPTEDSYMRLGCSKKTINRFGELKVAGEKVNDTFTLLWHNSHFNNDKDIDLYKGCMI